MNNFFVYNNQSGIVELNGPDLLLIKEFAALMDAERNKCKDDPKGEYKLRAFREFTYIYLAIHWNSPYKDYLERDRHEEALKDANMTEEEFNNPEFRAACRKFKTLQESHRSIRLLKAAEIMADKFIDYFMNVDPEERDPLTGKPIWKIETMQKEIANLHKTHEELVILEGQVKREITESTSIRAGAEDGFHPTF